MKKMLAILISALVYGTATYAQTTVVTSGSAPSASVPIEPESRTRIKAYVTEHHVAPVRTHERIVVGATVPEDVELQAVPGDWGPHLDRYRYIYSDSHVMLVEPSSRKVIQVVE